MSIRSVVVEVGLAEKRVKGQRSDSGPIESVYWPFPDCNREMTSFRVSKQVKILLGTILDESH